jgi:hypothetical protein
MVTEYPLAWSNLAKEAEIIPFPKEEVTPPVTKTYFVFDTWKIVWMGKENKYFCGRGMEIRPDEKALSGRLRHTARKAKQENEDAEEGKRKRPPRGQPFRLPATAGPNGLEPTFFDTGFLAGKTA